MTEEVWKNPHRKFVIAAWNNQADEVRETLAAHPEAIHWKDPVGGMTALHAAANQGGFPFFKFLLECKPDLDARNDKGETPLMYAIDNGGNTEHIRALLDAGADVFAADHEGKDALARAKKRGIYVEIFEAHIRGLDEKRAREEARQQAAAVDSMGEQMRAGADNTVAVRKPLRFKNPSMS